MFDQNNLRSLDALALQLSKDTWTRAGPIAEDCSEKEHHVQTAGAKFSFSQRSPPRPTQRHIVQAKLLMLLLLDLSSPGSQLPRRSDEI